MRELRGRLVGAGLLACLLAVRMGAETPGCQPDAERTDHDEFFVSWGYQPSLHGRLGRPELDALCPDRPVVLWQRSYHETYVNSAALAKKVVR